MPGFIFVAEGEGESLGRGGVERAAVGSTNVGRVQTSDVDDEVTRSLPDRVAIRVVLVDDHRVVRTGVSAYLDQIKDIVVIAEAENGRAAINRLAALEPAGELPDVVLMDLLMPVLDGVAATQEIKSRWPTVEVVAMTSFVEEATVRGALEAGAAGYLLKDAGADEVAAAIRAAVAGRMHLDPAVARLLADSVRRPRPLGPALTQREGEVLGLVAQGASNRQIAELLVISERTARAHVSAILGKLGLASRTQAALWAVQEGIAPGSRPLPQSDGDVSPA